MAVSYQIHRKKIIMMTAGQVEAGLKHSIKSGIMSEVRRKTGCYSRFFHV